MSDTNHIIPQTGPTIDDALAWAVDNMDAERFSTLDDLENKTGVEKESMVPDGNAVDDIMRNVQAIAQEAGYKLGGFVVLESVDDLPVNPTDKTIGYLIDGDLYLWVGEGGDTADGKYQNCGTIRGSDGPPGTTHWADLEDVPELAYLGADEGTVESASFDPEADTVHIAAQTLSSAQQQQVRQNIGAAGVNDVVGMPVVNHGTSDTTFSLTPNVFHVWGTVGTLTLSLATGEVGYVQEYMFEFTSGSTATTLTLPSTLKWINGVTPSDIEAGKTYQVSIMNGIGVIGGAE